MVSNVFSSRLDETHTEQHRTSGDYRGQVTALMIRGQSRTYSDDKRTKRTYSDDQENKVELRVVGFNLALC